MAGDPATRTPPAWDASLLATLPEPLFSDLQETVARRKTAAALATKTAAIGDLERCGIPVVVDEPGVTPPAPAQTIAGIPIKASASSASVQRFREVERDQHDDWVRSLTKEDS